MSDKKTIVVWFSCGAASAVAAKKTIELYSSTHIIRVVNNPIKEEHPDNQRFLKDVEKWIGLPIEFCASSKFPSQSCVDVWEKKRFMSSVRGAPCTAILKKEARQEWEKTNRPDFHVLGFTFDEIKRFEKFVLTERQNTLPVLIDLKITKKMCFEIIQHAGIELPAAYKLGLPNANCLGCVKATSPTYWNLIRKIAPEAFAERLEQSKRMGKSGARLVRYKGKRIMLDQLPPDAKGRDLKKMNIECGIFCEEK